MRPNKNEENSFVEIFGVSFKKEQIAEDFNGKPIYNEELEVSEGKIKEMAIVKLTNGTVVKYPHQDNKNSPQIIEKDDGYTHFRRIEGLTVWDTPKDDKYMFNNCNNAVVNAKREYSTEHGYMSGPGIYYKQIEVTHSEDKDDIKADKNCKNMTIHYSQGFDSFNPFARTY